MYMRQGQGHFKFTAPDVWGKVKVTSTGQVDKTCNMTLGTRNETCFKKELDFGDNPFTIKPQT